MMASIHFFINFIRWAIHTAFCENVIELEYSFLGSSCYSNSILRLVYTQKLLWYPIRVHFDLYYVTKKITADSEIDRNSRKDHLLRDNMSRFQKNFGAIVHVTS